jgi:myosin protein heavy chain
MLTSLPPQLEAQLDTIERERHDSARAVRSVDRTVKDLQSQLDRREKANSQLQDDLSRSRDKLDKLLKTIDELQTSESKMQLDARRAERELREEKERALRLERELEGWKALRVDKTAGTMTMVGGTLRRSSGRWRSGTPLSTYGSEAGGGVSSWGVEGQGIEIPKRKSSLKREASLSKGFL